MGFRETFAGLESLMAKVEGFKNDHKGASAAIGGFISIMPTPFDKFCNVIWEGVEGEDDSADKMLAILERMSKSTEASFAIVREDISKLLTQKATKEDIQQIGEQIRTSTTPFYHVLGYKLDEINDRLIRIELRLDSLTGVQRPEEDEGQAPKRKEERAIQDYHNKLIEEVYDPWSNIKIQNRDSLAGYPNTRNQPTYLSIDFEGVCTDRRTIEDAIMHLNEREDATTNKKHLIELVKRYNDKVGAFIQWRDDDISKQIDEECQLRPTYTTPPLVPQEDEYSVTTLVEYFDAHFYRGQEAEVRKITYQLPHHVRNVLYITYENAIEPWLANSPDPLKLCRLEAKLDEWGRHYKDVRADLDAQRQVVEGTLQSFKTALIPVKRRLAIECHLMTTKCAYEESFGGHNLK